MRKDMCWLRWSSARGGYVVTTIICMQIHVSRVKSSTVRKAQGVRTCWVGVGKWFHNVMNIKSRRLTRLTKWRNLAEILQTYNTAEESRGT